jgi:hypothetical protein
VSRIRRGSSQAASGGAGSGSGFRATDCVAAASRAWDINQANRGDYSSTVSIDPADPASDRVRYEERGPAVTHVYFVDSDRRDPVRHCLRVRLATGYGQGG